MQTFPEVMRRLEAEGPLKVDAVVNTRDHVELLGVGETDSELGVFFNTPELDQLDGQAVRITDYAHRQIAGRSQVPWSYYSRMLEKQPELLMENIHTWWRAEPENRLVRTARSVAFDNGSTVEEEPRLRAWLSDQFRVLDNLEFVPVVLAEAEKVGATIQSCHLDDERLYLKLVSPQRAAEVKRGDPIQAGVIVRNSEVGDGRVVVQPFALRLVCLNGMVMPTRYARMHLGSKLDVGILADDTIQADNKAVWLQVRDWVRHAFAHDNLEEMVAAFQAAEKVPVLASPRLAVANVVRNGNLSPVEAQGVLERFLRQNDDTQFGVVNAVTAAAHETDRGYRRQVELEELGGRLLATEGPAFTRLIERRLSEEEISVALEGK